MPSDELLVPYLTMTLLLIHLGLTAALFGLIWTIQLVHYPAFHFVAREQWSRFHAMHTRKITFIVFPLMLSELGIALWQLFHGPAPLLLIACCIPILQWCLTAFLFIPLHHKLSDGKDDSVIARTVNLNWLRTVFWSVELALLVFLIVK